MRRVHHLLPQQSRITLYNALMLPLFDYANIIWGDKNDVTLMDSLQILQNKAAKVILGLSPNHSAGEAFETLRWKPLHVRRQCHRCIVIYKSIKLPMTPNTILHT